MVCAMNTNSDLHVMGGGGGGGCALLQTFMISWLFDIKEQYTIFFSAISKSSRSHALHCPGLALFCFISEFCMDILWPAFVPTHR